MKTTFVKEKDNKVLKHKLPKVYLLYNYVYASMRACVCVCVCVSECTIKMAAGPYEGNKPSPLVCLRHVAGVREMCVCVFVPNKKKLQDACRERL